MFAEQAILVSDTFYQQVTYSKFARIHWVHKKKEKDGAKPAWPHVQTHFNEENNNLLFATMFPKVNKMEAQMRPNDDTLHDVGVNLSNAMAMDKLEMMEENLKAVSLDFIKKSCHLDKMKA